MCLEPGFVAQASNSLKNKEKIKNNSVFWNKSHFIFEGIKSANKTLDL